MTHTLTPAEARAFYDRFGARQDGQAFYEDRALAALLAHGDFGQARAVVEFGFGTGRLAGRLLAEHLPYDAIYHGFDLSATMVGLARERLAPFGTRARLTQTDGATTLPLPPGAADRFVCTYVLDLLSDEDIREVLAEAHRLLRPEGLLCLAALTHGTRPFSHLLTWTWSRVQAFRPALVGGCRPIALTDHLPEAAWTTRYHAVVTAFAVPSEVIVAARRAPPGGSLSRLHC